MRVVIFGASGGVGAHLVRLAAVAGHEVTAVMRAPRDVPARVRVLVGDVLDPRCIDEAVRGQDAVLSALGIRRKSQTNPWSPLASPPDFTTRTARTIVDAMRAHGVPRVLAVSASGIGDSRPGLNLMMRAMIAATNVGANYRDLEEMEKVYAGSDREWCCVRPTGLKDGPVTRRVDVIDRFPFNAWISRADVAWWMVEHLGADLTGLRTPTITEARR